MAGCRYKNIHSQENPKVVVRTKDDKGEKIMYEEISDCDQCQWTIDSDSLQTAVF